MEKQMQKISKPTLFTARDLIKNEMEPGYWKAAAMVLGANREEAKEMAKVAVILEPMTNDCIGLSRG